MFQPNPHPVQAHKVRSAKAVRQCDELRARVLRLELLLGTSPADEADLAALNKAIGNLLHRHRAALGYERCTVIDAYPKAFSFDALTPAERALATTAARQRGQGAGHGTASDVGAARHWTGDDAA